MLPLKRRALIAWDMGGGHGHVVHLAAVAKALRCRGFDLKARLLNHRDAREILPFCDSVEQAESLPLQVARDQPFPSGYFGDLLGLHGFTDPSIVKGAIARWRGIIARQHPEIVVCGLAPCALLAARTLGIPVVQVGVPCDTPPHHLAMFPGIPDNASAPLFDETEVLEVVNQVLAEFDTSALPFLPGVLACEDQITASIPLLDCFGRWRNNALVPPVVGDWVEPGERLRREVFVYLSTLERFSPKILTAVATIDLPVRVVVAGNIASALAILRRGGVAVEEHPVPASEIVRGARVLVHGGNHGISCLGLRAGLPQVALAANPEHIYDARQMASMGGAVSVEFEEWSVPRIHAAIRQAWEDPRITLRAEEIAHDLNDDFAGDSGAATADRIEAVLH